MTLPVPTLGDNPFATRWVRPGAVPFFFPPGESLGSLVERLADAGWWGQVVGPHGTGKSTLLAALLEAARAAGKATLATALHDGRRSLPRPARCAVREAQPGGRTVVVIDGYEQLSLWSRFRLQRRCRRRGHGLLVTAHADVGLPELYRTSVSLETALHVVSHLTRRSGVTVAAMDIASRLAAHGGNLREALFDLYDLFQRRQSAPAPERRREVGL